MTGASEEAAWHLRKAWAPVAYADQIPPQQENPVTRARPSARAGHPPSTTPPDGPGIASAAGYITWPPGPRNQVRFAGAKTTVPVLAQPTGPQRDDRLPNRPQLWNIIIKPRVALVGGRAGTLCCMVCHRETRRRVCRTRRDCV